MLCALASFLLAGRVSERTLLAFSLFVVLIGAFALFVLFGAAMHASPTAAVVLVVALIALFKLMSAFESARKSGGRKPKD